MPLADIGRVFRKRSLFSRKHSHLICVITAHNTARNSLAACLFCVLFRASLLVRNDPFFSSLSRIRAAHLTLARQPSARLSARCFSPSPSARAYTLSTSIMPRDTVQRNYRTAHYALPLFREPIHIVAVRACCRAPSSRGRQLSICSCARPQRASLSTHTVIIPMSTPPLLSSLAPGRITEHARRSRGERTEATRRRHDT